MKANIIVGKNRQAAGEAGQGLIEYALILLIIIGIGYGIFIFFKGRANASNSDADENSVIVQINLDDLGEPTIKPSGNRPEIRPILTEPAFEVYQNNCGGSSHVSNTVTKEQTIIYLAEVGREIEVAITGEATLPVLGKVNIGTALSEFYSVTYGNEDTLSSAIEVSATGGTNMVHVLRKIDYWENGLIVWDLDGGGEISFPYSFRRDFGIELVESTDLGCP